MRRLALVLFAGSLFAQSAGCGDQLILHWNKFVDDANAYVRGLAGGVKNVKLRGRLDKEWQAVTRCECF